MKTTSHALRLSIVLFSCTLSGAMHTQSAFAPNDAKITTYSSPEKLVDIHVIQKELREIAISSTIKVRRMTLILKDKKKAKNEKHLLFPEDTEYKGMRVQIKQYNYFPDAILTEVYGHVALEVLFVWIKYNRQCVPTGVIDEEEKDEKETAKPLFRYDPLYVILPANNFLCLPCAQLLALLFGIDVRGQMNGCQRRPFPKAWKYLPKKIQKAFKNNDAFIEKRLAINVFFDVLPNGSFPQEEMAASSIPSFDPTIHPATLVRQHINNYVGPFPLQHGHRTSHLGQQIVPLTHGIGIDVHYSSNIRDLLKAIEGNDEGEVLWLLFSDSLVLTKPDYQQALEYAFQKEKTNPEIINLLIEKSEEASNPPSYMMNADLGLPANSTKDKSSIGGSLLGILSHMQDQTIDQYESENEKPSPTNLDEIYELDEQKTDRERESNNEPVDNEIVNTDNRNQLSIFEEDETQGTEEIGISDLASILLVDGGNEQETTSWLDADKV
ncbi:MAG: hypothetical protein AAF335_02105 [Bacteroidota bacterium]